MLCSLKDLGDFRILEFLIYDSQFLVVLKIFQNLPSLPQLLPFPLKTVVLFKDCRLHQRLADNNAMRNTDLMRNRISTVLPEQKVAGGCVKIL